MPIRYFFLLTLFLSGCAQLTHLSDSENVWIIAKEYGVDKIVYCNSNRDISQRPVCHEAEIKMIDRDAKPKPMNLKP